MTHTNRRLNILVIGSTCPRSEGDYAFGRMLEGMLDGMLEVCGQCKPVIASAVRGVSDTADIGTTGYLVSKGDKDVLATATLDLVQGPAKAKSFVQAGLRFAQQKYNWDRITDCSEEFWHALCEKTAALDLNLAMAA